LFDYDETLSFWLEKKNRDITTSLIYNRDESSKIWFKDNEDERCKNIVFKNKKIWMQKQDFVYFYT